MNPSAHAGGVEGWIDRIELIVAYVLQLGIAIVTIGAVFQGKWLVVLSGVVILLLTFTPALIERRLHVPLPVEFTLITCVFLFASFVLGEARDFYERVWWWDLILHAVSAMITGFIGLLSLYVFYMTHRIRVAPIYVAILTFAIAVAVGTIWEIFEFMMDWLFGLNMQRSGLIDTMTDLMINAAGAIVAATFGFYYVRGGDSLFGRRLIRRLAEREGKNPRSKGE
ncbi:MAG: hypothetical protein ACE5KS_10375 [Woeseiaceae bacterium]